MSRRGALGAAGAGIVSFSLPAAQAAASPVPPAATAPGAPTQVEVAEGSTTAVLSWTAGTGTTGGATHTVEHRARDSEDTWTAFTGGAVTVSGTSATVTLPSTDVRLEYRVLVTDGGLTSAPSATARPIASGGDAVLLDGGDAVHTFTTTGSDRTLELHADRDLAALLIGGGGGGGRGSDEKFVAGGGGAGGFLELDHDGAIEAVIGDLTIRVGAGGAERTGGQASTLTAPGGSTLRDTGGTDTGLLTWTAQGGGPGRYVDTGGTSVAGDGASGGGGVATANNNVGGTGQPPTTVRDGGTATAAAPEVGSGGGSGDNGGVYRAGGGGGAGGAGIDGSVSGDGGPGRSSSMSGTAVVYAAGGGGGCSTDGVPGSGGSDIGGDGGTSGDTSGTAGAAGTGSGGGGAHRATQRGGAGGSGVVIVRVPLVASA